MLKKKINQAYSFKQTVYIRKKNMYQSVGGKHTALLLTRLCAISKTILFQPQPVWGSAVVRCLHVAAVAGCFQPEMSYISDIIWL